MLAMPYCPRLVGGWPLYVFLVFLKNAIFSKLRSFLVTFIGLVLEPNRQNPCGKPNVLPPKLVNVSASELWPGLLCFQYAPEWPPVP